MVWWEALRRVWPLPARSDGRRGAWTTLLRPAQGDDWVAWAVMPPSSWSGRALSSVGRSGSPSPCPPLSAGPQCCFPPRPALGSSPATLLLCDNEEKRGPERAGAVPHSFTLHSPRIRHATAVREAQRGSRGYRHVSCSPEAYSQKDLRPLCTLNLKQSRHNMGKAGLNKQSVGRAEGRKELIILGHLERLPGGSGICAGPQGLYQVVQLSFAELNLAGAACCPSVCFPTAKVPRFTAMASFLPQPLQLTHVSQLPAISQLDLLCV